MKIFLVARVSFHPELSVDVTSHQAKESTRIIKDASKRRHRFFDAALYANCTFSKHTACNHVSSCFSSSNVLANLARDKVRFSLAQHAVRSSFLKDSVVVPFIASAKSPEKYVPASKMERGSQKDRVTEWGK